jgi:hypothetical protein
MVKLFGDEYGSWKDMPMSEYMDLLVQNDPLKKIKYDPYQVICAQTII